MRTARTLVATGCVRMRMRVPGAVGVSVFVGVRELHVKFHPSDIRLLSTGDVDAPAVELEFFELVFDCPRIDAEVNHRADEHVPADAAEDIQIQCFHRNGWTAISLKRCNGSSRGNDATIQRLNDSTARALI